MFCWLFGHRYDYELHIGSDLSLICTKCGHWKTLVEAKAALSPTVPSQKIGRQADVS